MSRQGRLHSEINKHYGYVCPHCGGFKNEFKPVANLDEEVNKIIQAIYDGTFDGEIDPTMVDMIAQKLTDGVMSGYGKSIADFTDKDWNMINNLQTNIYSFSGAKNYQQLKTMTLALNDGNGGIISFADFKQIALQIDRQYNMDWLQTEYDTAIGSAQMAGKWNEFADDVNLEYTTAGDDRVRESHAVLDGTIKPKSDSFWNKYYPPNGYNCRCSVLEAQTGSESTPNADIVYPAIPKMWQTNLAKAGLVFPKSHPYFKGVPKDVLSQAEKLIQNLQ
jgi:SPP1 gp7 family putative phage head morphogenesis protein